MVADAMAWAAAHGLLMHAPPQPPPPSSAQASSADQPPTSAPLLVHAPFALLPASFPAEQLELATSTLATLFGKLVDSVGNDVPWLAQTLKGAAYADDFTRRLLRLCAHVAREGATQPIRLTIVRSDYMLHEPEGAHVGSGRLLQVQLDTLGASLACLGGLVGELHTSLAQRWPSARHHVWCEAGQPATLALARALPQSDAVGALAAAMAHAHALYGRRDAVVLFVVPPGETSRPIDEELLAERLWAVHGLTVVRRTLSHLAHEARLVGKERRLVLGGAAQVEVALVHLRAGHTPDDYPTNRCWDARATLERSHAIKCPCIEHHLVGCKKVQQQLALPGELERFLPVDEATTLRAVFAGLWSLAGPAEPSDGAPAEEHVAAMHMRLAIEKPSEYVMSPQREDGSIGGRSLFGEDLASALRTLSRDQRASYVLMQRLRPRRAPAVLVRDGAAVVGSAASELVVYSTLLSARPGKLLLNRAAGTLVRTRLIDDGGSVDDESGSDGAGGASAAFLSSPLAAAPPRIGGCKWRS